MRWGPAPALPPPLGVLKPLAEVWGGAGAAEKGAKVGGLGDRIFQGLGSGSMLGKHLWWA